MVLGLGLKLATIPYPPYQLALIMEHYREQIAFTPGDTARLVHEVTDAHDISIYQ